MKHKLITSILLLTLFLPARYTCAVESGCLRPVAAGESKRVSRGGTSSATHGLSNIAFEGESRKLWIKISENTYLLHEAFFWLIQLDYMSDSELGAETICDFFKQWQQGERTHFCYVEVGADKKIFEGLVVERVITKGNKSLPYYNWFIDNRRRIVESVEDLFIAGNIVIDGRRAVSLLATRPDELRYFLAHEYFHHALFMEGILSDEEIQLLRKGYSSLLQQAGEEELSDFIPGCEGEFRQPNFWHEFFAQCFYLRQHPPNEFWKMNASGEIYFDLRENRILVIGRQYLKKKLLSKWPFLEKVNQQSIEKANQAIVRIEGIVHAFGAESRAVPDTNKDLYLQAALTQI